jgi:5-methylthioribose kinase
MDIENPAELVAYLRARGAIDPNEAPRCETLYGGVSNRAVCVERANGDSWVIKQALSQLRVEVEWFSSPERIHREAAGLRRLAELAPTGTTTPFLFEDETEKLLAMEAVPKPHANWKQLLLAGQLVEDHVEQFGRLLATVGRAASQRADELALEFADRSFFETLRLEPYYSYAAEQVPRAAPFLQGLIEETRSYSLTLVHGDYSPKNVLIHEGRLVLLDHEVIHWGDPAFDLGFSLTHFLSKAHHLPSQREAFAAAAVHYFEAYLEELGAVPWRDALEERSVRHTLACLLARVAGRSPLEYLSEEERTHQRNVVVPLMEQPPPGIASLAAAFVDALNGE